MEIQKDLIVEMKPIRIMDRIKNELRNKKVPLVRVLWRNSQVKEKHWRERMR
jgi:hypothetical protein